MLNLCANLKVSFSGRTDTKVYYQEGGGPRNYACPNGIQNSALTTFNISDGRVDTDTDMPLVAVEVSGKP